MPNLPISGLPAGTPTLTKVLPQENPGILTEKVTYQQVYDLIISQFTSDTAIYVNSEDGVDDNTLPGAGTSLSPYKTVQYALLQAAYLPNTIYFFELYGTFIESSLGALNPNIVFNGNGSSLTVTSQLTLSSAWSTVNGSLIFSNFQYFDLPGGQNLDFSSSPNSLFGLTNIPNIIKESTPWNWIGNPSGTSLVYTNGSFGFNNIPDVTASDIQASFYDLNPNSLTLNVTSTSQPSSISLYSANIPTLNLNSNTSQTVEVFADASCQIQTANLTTTSTGFAGLINEGIQAFQQTFLNGTNSNWIGAPGSLIPIVSNGASLANNVQYLTIGNTINSNYIPVNFTFPQLPDSSGFDTSVTGAIAGIDNTLGQLGSGYYPITLSDVNQTLSNPCPNYLVVTGDGNANLFLPQMNEPNSLGSNKNSLMLIVSNTNSSWSLATNGGAQSLTIPAGPQNYLVFITDNSSVDGAFNSVQIPNPTSFATYNPTIAGLDASIASATMFGGYYMVNGNMVTISGRIQIDIGTYISTGRLNIFNFPLPFPIQSLYPGNFITLEGSSDLYILSSSAPASQIGIITLQSGSLPTSTVYAYLSSPNAANLISANNPLYFNFEFSYLATL